MQEWGGSENDQVYGYKYTLSLKFERKICLKFESTSHFKNVAMLAFHDSIFLWSMVAKGLEDEV